jgi:hypothetical protein
MTIALLLLAGNDYRIGADLFPNPLFVLCVIPDWFWKIEITIT